MLNNECLAKMSSYKNLETYVPDFVSKFLCMVCFTFIYSAVDNNILLQKFSIWHFLKPELRRENLSKFTKTNWEQSNYFSNLSSYYNNREYMYLYYMAVFTDNYI